MQSELKQHYLTTGVYTDAEPYKDYFRSLPDDIEELGNLVCSQIIHRVTLAEGNTNANASLAYGDMNNFPWHRMRCEDDILMTATAMTAELFRLDKRGFHANRAVENKIVVTCRYVSVLMTAILKAKGIPARSRAGFAGYFDQNSANLYDHWINQYWDEERDGWVNIDADGFFDPLILGFHQYDMPASKYNWAAQTWKDIRSGELDGRKVTYAGGLTGLRAVIRAIFYDFHALMNNEISYLFQPAYIDGKFDRLTEPDLIEIDDLADLLTEPDKNFQSLKSLWENRRRYRILNSPLVGDTDTTPLMGNTKAAATKLHIFD